MKQGLKQLQNSSGTYVSVFYDTDLQATVDVWTGPFETTDHFKAGLLLVLENIERFASKKWLADISLMEGNFEFAKEFIAHNVIPKAMKLGLTCEALVLPNNIFALLSVQETGMVFEDTLELRMFATTSDAIGWLKTKA